MGHFDEPFDGISIEKDKFFDHWLRKIRHNRTKTEKKEYSVILSWIIQ